VSILVALNAKTLELRKARDPLAGSFQGIQALATANAKDRLIKEQAKLPEDQRSVDFSTVKADEQDAIAAVQKGIKQVRDTLALVPTDAKSLRELEILESLMPKQPSEDEIRGEIEAALNTMGERPKGVVGMLMKHLVAVFGATLDKGKASATINKVLAA